MSPQLQDRLLNTSPTQPRLPDRIEHMLAAFEQSMPRAVACARDVLPSLLAPLQASTWPQVAWQWSRLTADGFPVEVTLARPGTIEFITEVAGPEVDHSLRLDAAASLLKAQSLAALPRDLEHAIREHQRPASLRWGARVQMTATDSLDDQTNALDRACRLQLIAELVPPAPPERLISSWAALPSSFRSSLGPVRLVCYDARTCALQLYFCLRRPSVATCRTLLSAVALDTAAFAAAVHAIRPASDESAPFASMCGFLLEITPDTRIMSATFLLPARYWPHDRAVLGAATSLQATLGLANMPLEYACTAGDHAPGTSPKRRISVLGFCVERTGAYAVLKFSPG